MILVLVAFAVVAMISYETLRTETYTSFAQLYLSGDVQLNTGIYLTEDTVNYYGTQVELLKSARLQGAAFERAGITIPAGKRSPFKVEVFQPMKTSILVVQATGPDPVQVQKLLQSLVEEYLSYKKDTRKSTTEDLVSSLTAELAKRETELKAEQDKWADFQKSNNVAVLEEQAKSAGLYLSDLTLQLDKLRLERKLLQSGLRTRSSNVGSTELTSLGLQTNAWLVAGDASLKTAQVELAVLVAQRADQTNLLSESHPAVRKLNSDIARLQKMVSVLQEQDLSQKQLNREELDKRIAAIEGAIPAIEAKVLGIDERFSEGQRYKTSIQRQQGFYDHLLSMLQGVDLSKSVEQERLSVLQEASPARLTERYLALRVGLAGLASGFLGLGIVFVWYLLDDRLVSMRDIKEQFGEPLLGVVPQIKVPRSSPGEALIRVNDHRGLYAEAYRHLRSALLLSSTGERPPQTLLFTGAGPSEGKTTVALNLSQLLARSGYKVVVIDADIHSARIHQLLNRPSGPGLLDYLLGQATVGDVTHSTETDGLKLIPVGTTTGNPDDLLSRARLEPLLGELRKQHDFIILDGAPILAADDPALLVPHCDAVVLVVRTFYTRSRAVRQVLDMLYQRNAKRVALVLNRARAEDFAGRYTQNGTRRVASEAARAVA